MSYREAEKQRLQALLEADGTALAQHLAEDVHYVHSTGRVDTRQSLLELFSAGDTTYLELEHDLSPVVETADLVVAHGSLRMLLEKSGESRRINATTTTVWVLEAGQWKLRGFHSSSATA